MDARPTTRTQTQNKANFQSLASSLENFGSSIEGRLEKIDQKIERYRDEISSLESILENPSNLENELRQGRIPNIGEYNTQITINAMQDPRT